MENAEKIELLEEIVFGDIDWIESYRQTFSVPNGIGLPSGLTWAETETVFVKRVLKDEPVIIIGRA